MIGRQTIIDILPPLFCRDGIIIKISFPMLQSTTMSVLAVLFVMVVFTTVEGGRMLRERPPNLTSFFRSSLHMPLEYPSEGVRVISDVGVVMLQQSMPFHAFEAKLLYENDDGNRRPVRSVLSVLVSADFGFGKAKMHAAALTALCAYYDKYAIPTRMIVLMGDDHVTSKRTPFRKVDYASFRETREIRVYVTEQGSYVTADIDDTNAYPNTPPNTSAPDEVYPPVESAKGACIPSSLTPRPRGTTYPTKRRTHRKIREWT